MHRTNFVRPVIAVDDNLKGFLGVGLAGAAGEANAVWIVRHSEPIPGRFTPALGQRPLPTTASGIRGGGAAHSCTFSQSYWYRLVPAPAEAGGPAMPRGHMLSLIRPSIQWMREGVESIEARL
jgi:hypothetical protein